MGTTQDRELLLDVEELTAMLRDDPVLERLREALIDNGLQPGATLLVGFLESERYEEWGVLVSKDGRVFEYERDTEPGARGFKKFAEVRDLADTLKTFPAGEVGLRLARQGIASR